MNWPALFWAELRNSGAADPAAAPRTLASAPAPQAASNTLAADINKGAAIRIGRANMAMNLLIRVCTSWDGTPASA